MLLTGVPVVLKPDNEVDEASIRETISKFGTKWIEFYNSETTSESSTTMKEVHQALALVAAIGCPQVIADLIDNIQGMEVQT